MMKIIFGLWSSFLLHVEKNNVINTRGKNTLNIREKIIIIFLLVSQINILVVAKNLMRANI